MIEASQLKYIPQELKYNGLWCGWKLTEKGKVPFNVETDKFAKSNDSSTFSNYPTLLHNIHKYLKFDDFGKQIGGIGLGIFNGYSAIDIDHCVNDGKLSDMARDIIDYCQSYTEYSPSKTGIRIIFKTDILINKEEYYINNHNNGLEIYISNNTSKFVSITGNRISDAYSDIKEVNIQYILDKYMKKNEFNLDRILEKDSKFKELWFSSAPGSHSNESELDMALCCKLAYYLKSDVNLIKQYFEQSPFYKSKDSMHLKKWDRGYGLETIKNSINYVGGNVSNYRPVATSNKKYELNDTGNARRFVERFGSDIRYNVDNCKWMIWNDRFWQYDVKDKIKDYVEILAEEMSFESNSINDTNERVRALKNIDRIYNVGGKEALLKESQHIGNIPVLNDDLDRDSYLVCCNNGTINLKTSELSENIRDNMISQVTGSDIDLNNEPELFIKFLNEIFEGNENLIHYIQKALGYSMSNVTREQCMFILLGDGNNGKSLLMEVIRETLGTYAISTRPQLLTEQRNGNSNLEEIARLKGKRMIVVEEVKSGDKLDESLVKSLTSGIGNQVARFLYGNSFEFPVTGKIWMATNYMPVIRGNDRGIWRRIKVIPVNVDFTGREDKDLKYKLLSEMPKILGWLLKGYEMYMSEGLEEPSEIKTSIKEVREEFDIVQRWINECCEVSKDKNVWTAQKDLFTNFNAYCKQTKEFEMNSNMFGRNMGKKFQSKVYGGRTIYLGIRIRQDSQDLDKKVAFDNIKVNDDI